MIDMITGNKDVPPLYAIDTEELFSSIRSESGPFIKTMIKILEYLNRQITGNNNGSSLYCGKVSTLLSTEKAYLIQLLKNDDIDSIIDNDILSVQYYSRQCMDVVLRVFYISSIKYPAKCLYTKTLKNDVITVFVGNELYNDDGYSERWFIYKTLFAYLDTKMNQGNAIELRKSTYFVSSFNEILLMYWFYRSLGMLYYDLVGDYDIIDNIGTYCSDFEIIKDSFKGTLNLNEFLIKKIKDECYVRT
ncbi:MAG: hypothetical protein IKR19_07505 [Acholeplasmatales bacterium]|nr:hypothetical protein [Acholeplasmatales bacterium]